MYCKSGDAIQKPYRFKGGELPKPFKLYQRTFINHNPRWLFRCCKIICDCGNFHKLDKNEKYIHMFKEHFVKIILQFLKKGHLPIEKPYPAIRRVKYQTKLREKRSDKHNFESYGLKSFCIWLNEIDETVGLCKVIKRFV
jgi:hypothetical protein